MTSGVELATAWVRIIPSFDGAQGEIAKGLDPVAEAAGEDAGKKAGAGMGRGLKVGLAAAAGVIAAGLAATFKTGIEELKFGEQVSAQTDQLIKNTNAAFSTSMIEDYTLALSKVSGVSEEDLQSAGNTLLKFGVTNEETYKRAVSAINDMAASGKDAGQVGQALGKSLQDPLLAVAGLRKQGVAFTAEQEEMIKTMVASGDAAGAQAVILDQVENVYGGMAEKTGGTLQGNINKLTNMWENMAGTVVSSLMPAIEGLVSGLSGFFSWLEENQWVLPIIATAIGVILVAAFIAWTASIWAANAALLANPITWIILAIVALIAAVVLLVMNWDTVVAFLTDVWNGFIDWFIGVMDGFLGWWNGLWTDVWEWLVSVWNGIVAFANLALSSFFKTFQIIGAAIASWWNNLWNGISRFFSGIWDGIMGAIKNVQAGFRAVFEGIASIVRGAFEGVVSVVTGVINGVIDAVNGAISGINSVAGAIGGALGINLQIGKIPRLADGATILPRNGGTLAVLAEAGRPESVVDTGLMNRALEQGIGTGGPEELVIVDQNGELIGRMRVEARNEVDKNSRNKSDAARRGYRGGF